jgi:hypothetical protein
VIVDALVAGLSDDSVIAEPVDRLALDEAIRALNTQADALAGLRTRAGTVLAATALATSFFGGQAFENQEGLGVAGWFAVAAFIVSGSLTILVLFPIDVTFSSGVRDVFALSNDAAEAGGSAEQHLALHLGAQYDENMPHIARWQRLFRAGAVVLLIEVLLWMIELGG